MSEDRRIDGGCSGRRSEIAPEHCKLQHQFIDRLLQELEKRIDQRFEAEQTALILKASEEFVRRVELQKEFEKITSYVNDKSLKWPNVISAMLLIVAVAGLILHTFQK